MFCTTGWKALQRTVEKGDLYSTHIEGCISSSIILKSMDKKLDYRVLSNTRNRIHSYLTSVWGRNFFWQISVKIIHKFQKGFAVFNIQHLISIEPQAPTVSIKDYFSFLHSTSLDMKSKIVIGEELTILQLMSCFANVLLQSKHFKYFQLL